MSKGHANLSDSDRRQVGQKVDFVRPCLAIVYRPWTEGRRERLPRLLWSGAGMVTVVPSNRRIACKGAERRERDDCDMRELCVAGSNPGAAKTGGSCTDAILRANRDREGC